MAHPPPPSGGEPAPDLIRGGSRSEPEGAIGKLRGQAPFLVGATHCVALMQQRRVPEQGEAVPRPYRRQLTPTATAHYGP